MHIAVSNIRGKRDQRANTCIKMTVVKAAPSKSECKKLTGSPVLFPAVNLGGFVAKKAALSYSERAPASN